MASERDKVRADVVPGSQELNEPAELLSALSSANDLKHELAKKKEENRHTEVMRDKEIAAAAAIADQNRALAPVMIASIVVVFSLGFVGELHT